MRLSRSLLQDPLAPLLPGRPTSSSSTQLPYTAWGPWEFSDLSPVLPVGCRKWIGPLMPQFWMPPSLKPSQCPCNVGHLWVRGHTSRQEAGWKSLLNFKENSSTFLYPHNYLGEMPRTYDLTLPLHLSLQNDCQIWWGYENTGSANSLYFSKFPVSHQNNAFWMLSRVWHWFISEK